MMTFEEWTKGRQDVRQWSEDERACAELAWREAMKEATKEMSWLEHHIHNLEQGGAK